MAVNVPLTKFPECSRALVAKKFVELQQYEQEIPAIFIVHDLRDASVLYMSQNGRDILGVSLEEIQLSTAEYHARYFNPEDVPNYVPKLLSLIERNNTNELTTFFQQVRPSPDQEWSWYLSAVKIFLRDEHEKPLLTLTLAIPIDSQSHITTKVERLVQENNFLRKHHHLFATLTRREKQMLRLMALGHSSVEIAEQLHISETTVQTHRRNIKSKLKAQTTYDLTRFAQAFDLI